MNFSIVKETQPRKLEIVGTGIPVQGTSTIKGEPPAAKPWAHFIAGGYTN